MDEERDNGSQGELFNEIPFETTETDEDGSEAVSRSKKKVGISFDKFLTVVLLLIIVISITFAVGVHKGRRVGERREPVRRETSPRTAVVQKKPVKKVSMPMDKKLPAALKAPAVEEATVSPSTLPMADEWTLQVVTYTSQSHAESEVRKLRNEGFSPFIIPSGKYYQVCVNRFSSLKEAKKLQPVFTKEKGYFDAFVSKVER